MEAPRLDNPGTQTTACHSQVIAANFNSPGHWSCQLLRPWSPRRMCCEVKGWTKGGRAAASSGDICSMDQRLDHPKHVAQKGFVSKYGGFSVGLSLPSKRICAQSMLCKKGSTIKGNPKHAGPAKLTSSAGRTSFQRNSKPYYQGGSP